ncbi:MAG TPA: ABC transporter transmembrane domain-containing protein, partial [Burkholderiaceae bacterium]|nr:ABC transporter transmembrane domain-containing protein [Burkholderiaceae bacterium]
MRHESLRGQGLGAGSQDGDRPLSLRAGAQTLSLLWPYVRRWRGRFLLALACMVAAKLAVVAVPIVLGRLVDGLAIDAAPMSAVLPVSLIIAYGALRLSTSLLTELREFFFARVTRAAERSLALRAFEHLHALSLRFHLDRQTGALIRQIDHGVRAVGSLVSFTLYSIVPTVIELALVMAYLLWHYEVYFALIVGVSVLLYVVFTFSVTQWRTRFRREMNELDAKASAQAMDSLLNFETVKYFNNAAYEADRYDAALAEQERAAIKTQQSLSALNAGQQLIVAVGLTLVLWRAAVGVQSGQMSVGDLVLINAFMMQLYAPLNFLGVIYRQIRQSVIDLERM